MKTRTDPRHNARRIALASLFCWLFSEPDHNACRNLSVELFDLSETDFDTNLTNNIIEGIKNHRVEIDEVIKNCAPEWPIDKISKVDLIILRIAVFELMYSEDAPDKVVIDEAVELAKEFGGDTSSKFVNGVLGTVVDIKKEIKKSEPPESDEKNSKEDKK